MTDYNTVIQKSGELPYTGSDWLIPMLAIAIFALWAALILWLRA